MYSIIATVLLVAIILSPIALFFFFRKQKRDWNKKSEEDQNKVVFAGIAIIVGIIVHFLTGNWLIAGVCAGISEVIILAIAAKYKKKKAN